MNACETFSEDMVAGYISTRIAKSTNKKTGQLESRPVWNMKKQDDQSVLGLTMVGVVVPQNLASRKSLPA
ncbi:MAG: hypothetical protein ACK46A_07010, partial [Akkermansiaceae bacterium]